MTVILSAWIRLAEVGIGCDAWPACYGFLGSAAEQQGIAVLTEAGRDMDHRGARLAHRYIASALGLMVIAVVVVALRQGAARRTSFAVPLTILAITVFLSILGYYTPTRSNPLITLGNLTGGMGLLGLLWWLLQRETDPPTGSDNSSALKPLALITLLLVSLQVVLGGWSSANYASSSCPQLLSCTGDWATMHNVSSAYNPLKQVPLDSAGQVVREPALGVLAMGHRLFSLITAAWLAWLVRRLRTRPDTRATAASISLFSISLIVAGTSMIWWQWPLWLTTLHNALAAGLLVSAVNLLHRVTPPPAGLPPPD
jgi:cytochrome c oxidase assembly protein subunit 15